jgi:serine/threonine-protein kinase
MGAVYEVVDQRTQRRRALKVMLPSLVGDGDLRARFALEARVTANVESDHIVETFDAGIDEETGSPFLVMELLRGEDLGARLEKGVRVPAPEVVALLRQAGRALDRTHDAGIVHRDLKPSNLFLTRADDGSPRLRILDFGIAKFVAQSTDSFKTTRSVGTPVYMSPEQIRGDGAIDRRADIYSLAHIAYALLVGEAYWETEARASESVYPLLIKVAQGAREPATVRAAARGVALPGAFDPWFFRGTAPDPSERFPTAGELVGQLARAFEGSAASSTPPTHTVRLSPPPPGPAAPVTDLTLGTPAPTPRRSRAPMAVIAGAVVAGTLAGVAVLARHSLRATPTTVVGSPAYPSESAAPASNPVAFPTASVLPAASASVSPAAPPPLIASTSRPTPAPPAPPPMTGPRLAGRGAVGAGPSATATSTSPPVVHTGAPRPALTEDPSDTR